MRGRFSTIDPEALRHMIETEKLTQKQCAERLGCGVSAIERACKRLKLRTQRTGPRSGALHTNWKGGIVTVGRYQYTFAPDNPMATKRGYVATHRLRVSEREGRPLERGEVVHHIDGNPMNNDLDNLQLFPSNNLHLKHELTGRVPNWTEEGKERIAAGVAKSASLRRTKPRDPKMP